MLRIWNDPGFIRFVGDRGIRTVDEARQALEDGILRQYEALGYGPYLLTLRREAVPVGICGLFRRDGLDMPDIGYTLLGPFRGRGYAFEAARAVIDDARTNPDLPEICAIVTASNRRSVRLLEKLGLRYVETIRLPDDDSDLQRYGIRLSGRVDGAG